MRRRIHATVPVSSELPRGPGATKLGLFRREPLITGPSGTLTNIFADLSRFRRGELIGENPDRDLQGTRLHIDRSEGHATWEFYRLHGELFVVTSDGIYDDDRDERAPGEGLVEFHLRLTGVLELQSHGWPSPVIVTGPSLLVLHQPPGVEVAERLRQNMQDSCISLYCKPRFLAELAARNGVAEWAMLNDIEQQPKTTAWYRQMPLSPMLNYIGTSLLRSPYRGELRLLHAEAKVLELLCELLAAAQGESIPAAPVTLQNEVRQLEAARRLLASNLSAPLRICDIARSVGMSESKLKRTFKLHYGTTVFDYGLERRMGHALELLRTKRMSVGQVAFAVGYRHQTSFASAFQGFHGYLPSKARLEMH